MGKRFSILQHQIETVNLLCKNEKFLKITGFRLKYSIRSRCNCLRVERSVIIVEKIIEGEDPAILGQVTVPNISKIITIAQFIISINDFCKNTIDDKICCICLERCCAVALMCRHGYCMEDMESDWDNIAMNCPMCKRILVYNQKYPSLDHSVDDDDYKQAIKELLSLINPI